MTRPTFKYQGAAAMIELHKWEIRSFVETWTRARTQGVSLPESEDDAYRSFDALLRHVLDSAGSYMRWVCRSLDLKDPAIPDLPDQLTDDEIGPYLDHMLSSWGSPLKEVEEARFFHPNHPSSGEDLCVELMLEHAIVHPMRHRLQLEQLLGSAG